MLSTLQQTIRLLKGNYEKYVIGTSIRVRLHFYLYGLMAEIIDTDNDINEEGE